jgi:hypothetical protein
MDEHKWVRHYSLCLDVFSVASEMELATGNISRCTALMKEVYQNAASVDDCIPVYLTEVVNGRTEWKPCRSNLLGNVDPEEAR